MILGIGTDLLRVSRLFPTGECRAEDPFVLRAFTPAERALAFSRTDTATCLAGRFSAKEAVYKAVCFCGLDFIPGEIEILSSWDGRPWATLLGKTKEGFERAVAADYTIHISLSHDTDFVTAVAVAEQQEEEHA